MERATIVETLRSGRTLVSDGAWGTFLQRKGLQTGECPERWCLDRPEDVRDIARRYIAAGADMVETNSFGASSLKLAHYGLADSAPAINEAAARLSREAAGARGWVLGSMGPTGKMLLMGDVTEEDLLASFGEQAAALVRGGADALCIETMTAADEAGLAVRASRAACPGAEIICTFTFDRTVQGDYRTMMGLGPEEAVAAALDAGADIVGTNCGNGMEGMIGIVRRMRAAFPKAPILVHANAGLPETVDGRPVWPETPEQMAALAPALVEAGAGVIGGCCGTTPEHIAALVKAVRGHG